MCRLLNDRAQADAKLFSQECLGCVFTRPGETTLGEGMVHALCTVRLEDGRGVVGLKPSAFRTNDMHVMCGLSYICIPNSIY